MKLFFTLPGKTWFRTWQNLLSAAFAFLLINTAAAQTVRTAANASQLNAAIAASNPGDTIIMTNGTWTNVAINFNAIATAAQPIVLRAQTPGKVILNGSSSLLFSAPYLMVNGLYFKGGALTTGSIVRFNSTNCRLTNTAIVDYNPPSTSTSTSSGAGVCASAGSCSRCGTRCRGAVRPTSCCSGATACGARGARGSA